MAAGIIHDFKNPMSVVQGTADLIRARDPENPKLSRQCEVIRRQVERMAALTRDVLEYSRGDTVLEPDAVDLGDYLEVIRDLHDEPFRRAGVKLGVEAGEPVQVLIDPGRMQRVVDNLLTNAREVSRVGDTVRMGWECRGREVRLEVRDEGPGIPGDVAETLFDPFVTSGKEGGSGLGLAISRKIVDDHGARIEVVSEPGRGATFAITLPEKLLVEAEPSTVKEGAAG
jgi:signal transduction histidine kinase